MPIVICTNCDKKYSLKDEMAGKTLRCKVCQSVIVVPAAKEEDPFAGVDLRSSGRALRDEDDADVPRPGRRLKRNSSKARSKWIFPGKGIPLSTILTLACQSLIVAYEIFKIVEVAGKQPLMSQTLYINTLTFSLVHVAVAGVVLVGFVKRSHTARRWSRVFCLMGIVFTGPALIWPPMKLHVEIPMLVALWTVIAVCLSTTSAAEWFNE